jgi:two-component system phosphate regulon response regulator PhoB
MIMPKSRELGARKSIHQRAKESEAYSPATVRSDGKTIEVSLVLPLEQGLDLVERLRSGTHGEHAPIMLWSGRQGAVEIAVRQGPGEGAAPHAVIPVQTSNRTGATPPASARPDMERIEIAGLVINPGRHEVVFNGKAVPQLTFTEFGILHFLARHPGWVFNRQQIVAGVRGEDYPVTDRAVDVQVAGLRKKLGAASDCVQTVRGVGYRFRD